MGVDRSGGGGGFHCVLFSQKKIIFFFLRGKKIFSEKKLPFARAGSACRVD